MSESQSQTEPGSARVPLVVSVVAQVGPLHLPGVPSADYEGPLDRFVEDMTRYVAENLRRFADQRGGDTFVTVTATRGDEKAAHEYRDGHYVREETP